MNTDKPYIIALDFDGTVVMHEYPKIGSPVPLAFETLRWLQESPLVKIFLWTIRSNEQLIEAQFYLEDKGIKLWGINENPDQHTWSKSRKGYANLYIDDAAFGAPIISGVHVRPFLKWAEVIHSFQQPFYQFLNLPEFSVSKYQKI